MHLYCTLGFCCPCAIAEDSNFCGCRDKYHKLVLVPLKVTEIYPLTVLEARSPIKVLAGPCSLQSLWGRRLPGPSSGPSSKRIRPLLEEQDVIPVSAGQSLAYLLSAEALQPQSPSPSSPVFAASDPEGPCPIPNSQKSLSGQPSPWSNDHPCPSSLGACGDKISPYSPSGKGRHLRRHLQHLTVSP